METINGVTVMYPDAGGAIGEAERGPVVFGPNQNANADVADAAGGPRTPMTSLRGDAELYRQGAHPRE